MSQARLKLMEELLEGVKSLEDLTTKLQHPGERELLKRISLLRCFDEAIFDQYLTESLPEDGVIEFTEFVKNLDVESVPRTRGVFAIKEQARNLYLGQVKSEINSDTETWQNERQVFQKLLTYYEKAGTDFDLDRLALLIVLNPERARNEFEALYTDADKRFALADCNDLLRTLEIRLPLLSDDLRHSYLSRRQYYNARNLYITDYYQTATYLDRSDLTRSFAEFLTWERADSNRWVFHVYATGGLGKTMFVRSLISRYCLPEPNRIPVARLDFDQLDLAYASRYPLLLLLPIADQIDQQIAEQPFREVFSSMWEFKPLLETPMGGAASINRAELETSFKSIEPSWRETALKEFCRTLKEIRFDKPILIAIDTFEDMLFLNKDALVSIIKQVQQMHEVVPTLRLILSGRYNLSEKLKDDLDSFFKNETISCELKRFTKEEARTYLTEKRNLKDEPLIEAIVEKCGEKSEGEINPFVLSLMSDLVSAKEIETVDDVRKYPRAEVAYMIQRIIDRIPDYDVRWLLRYAVVPRVLTFEVVDKILWPHLKQQRQGRSREDFDKKKFDDFDQTEHWRYGEASTAEAAWERLSSFVSSYSWIQYEGKDKSRLRLHPEVVVPIRFLLAEEDIFKLLHKDASLHFARKAEAKPREFVDWISEAIYHRFQHEGEKASDFWRQQLKSQHIKGNLEARRSLASEITKKRDYVDEKGTPLNWPCEDSAETIVSNEDLCAAHYEVADASIKLATKYKPETVQYADEWEWARKHLLKLDALLQSSPPADFKLPFDLETYVKLAAELNKPLINYDLVTPLMEEALSSTQGLSLPLCLQLQLAELYAKINSGKAEIHFRSARDASNIRGIPFLSPAGIHFKLAHWYQNSKRFAEALAEYDAALARKDLGESSALRREIKHQKAEVNEEIGLYISAARIAQDLYGSTPDKAPDRFDHALLFGRMLSRYLSRPLLVLNGVRELYQLAGDTTKQTAAVTELHGCILSQLMDFKEAPNVLELGKEQWRRVPDAVSADRARMYRFEFQLDQIGNVNEVAFLLEAWETDNDKQNANDPDLTCQLGLLRVRSLYLQGEDEKALERWRFLSERKDVTASKRSLARVLSTGLALGFGGSQTLEQLIAVLAEIHPASARLPLLGAFRFADNNTVAATAQHDELIEVLEWPPEKNPAVASVLMFVDVLRFCHATDRIKVLLQDAIGKSLDRQDLFAYVQLLSALNRSGLYSSPDAHIYGSAFLEDYKSHPNLCYAVLLEHAERELENGNLDQCEMTLRDAVNNYANSEPVTRWKAFAEELSGRLARQRGDAAKAATHFAEASSIYERLGNKRLARQIRIASFSKKKRKVLERSARLGTIHSIRLEAVDDEVVVTSDGSGRQKTRSRTFPRSDLSTQLIASLRDRTQIFALTKRITDDFTGFTQDLGGMLLGTEELEYFRQLRDGEPFSDARIELPLAAAKIPWEWASVERDTVLSFFRYFYRSSSINAGESEAVKWIHSAASLLSNVPLKIDGFFGPPIRELLQQMGINEKAGIAEIYESLSQRLIESAGREPIRALIVKPSFETQLSTQRGSFASSFSPQFLYDESGFSSESIDVFQPERLAADLASAMATVKPHLIHIETSFVQSPTTADVYLDFNLQSGSDRTFNDTSQSTSDYVQLSTNLLNAVLTGLPDSMLRPLVILEGQRTPSLSSTVHQVLLRNTFASELFRLGKTSGVIATGLFRYPEDRARLLKPLINRLSTSGSVGMAVNEINSRNIETKADLDLISCPVLLTDNPFLILLPTQ